MNYWKLSTLVLAGALAFVTFNSIEPAQADAQPRMQALAQLKVAKHQLERATPDKGGHRVKALAATNVAIAEVEKGIAYDNQNLTY